MAVVTMRDHVADPLAFVEAFGRHQAAKVALLKHLQIVDNLKRHQRDELALTKDGATLRVDPDQALLLLAQLLAGLGFADRDAEQGEECEDAQQDKVDDEDDQGLALPYGTFY
jgi:hypothetical protein